VVAILKEAESDVINVTGKVARAGPLKMIGSMSNMPCKDVYIMDTACTIADVRTKTAGRVTLYGSAANANYRPGDVVHLTAVVLVRVLSLINLDLLCCRPTKLTRMYPSRSPLCSASTKGGASSK